MLLRTRHGLMRTTDFVNIHSMAHPKASVCESSLGKECHTLTHTCDQHTHQANPLGLCPCPCAPSNSGTWQMVSDLGLGCIILLQLGTPDDLQGLSLSLDLSRDDISQRQNERHCQRKRD